MYFNNAFNNGNRELSRDNMMRIAPSIFAETPAEHTTDRYLFVPTIAVVNQIENQGFVPVYANQSRSNKGKHDEVKHVIRFRRKEHLEKQLTNVGDSVSELVLTNSHNGTTSFQISLGLFRQVCSNGLICSDSLAQESVRHLGYSHDKIIDAQYKVLKNEDKLIESVQGMREVNLNREEQLLLAKSALSLKYGDGKTAPKAEQLLRPRRYADDKTDLWTTFNVIQENMLRGGLRTFSVNNNGRVRRNRTRQVNSVSENKRLNQALWTLAEGMKQLKL